ncbi:MAG: hypothetical protein QXZ63_06665 [Sulfolobales archaeon]
MVFRIIAYRSGGRDYVVIPLTDDVEILKVLEVLSRKYEHVRVVGP